MAVDVFVNRAILDGLRHLDLIVTPQEMNYNNAAIVSRGFKIAGTLTADAMTTIRLRLNLRNSGDGVLSDPNLAVVPVFPISAKDTEVMQHMLEVVTTRYADDAVSRNVSRVASKPELVTELRDFEHRVKANAERLAPASLRTEVRRKGKRESER
jgi:hypothetical protein